MGLATAVVLADLGHKVTGVEIDPERIEKLLKGLSPIYEAHLQELLTRAVEAGSLRFTDNHPEACKDADVTIIAVGTPTRETWEIDLSYLESAVESVANAIEQRNPALPPPLIAIKSTVPSGTCEYLQTLAKRKTPSPFFMVSNPEFLREGQAIHDTFYPDRIVIGANEEEAFKIMHQLYLPVITQEFEDSPPRPPRPSNLKVPIPVVKTSPRSAEMIKYAANAFLATKISFINEIANLCEEVGADINDVAIGIGLDPRIGTQFLKAGIGYGGSCFPKDTKALHHHAGSRGYTFTLLNAVIEVNRIQRYRFLAKIRKFLHPLSDKTLGILGLAFKPGTDDIREAPSIDIMRELKREGASLKATDPKAIENARRVFNGCEYHVDPYETVKGCDAVVLVTEWQEFVNLDWAHIAHIMKGRFVFDGRNCLDVDVLKAVNLEVIGVGR